MVTDKVRQFLCSLHGHDALLHFESGRMSLKCTSCEYETPGWDVSGRDVSADLSSPPPVSVPLVGERRVA